MVLDFLRYAWRGSITLAGGLSSVLGVFLLWLLLRWYGRGDVVAPTTLIGSIEFFIVSTALAWCAIFLIRLLWAPIHYLRLARAELASSRRLPALEILFDPSDPAFVRPIKTLYDPTGEFFWIGVRNVGLRTLDDVTVRALDSWFTREAIALALTGHSTRSHAPIEIIRKDALHPNAEELVQCFGLDYHSGVSAPEYIFNTVQRFTLEATARDAATVRRVFEYDPSARPMLKMLPA